MSEWNYIEQLEAGKKELFEVLKEAEHYLRRFYTVAITKIDDPRFTLERVTLEKAFAATGCGFPDRSDPRGTF
jgi:hypothetical protein